MDHQPKFRILDERGNPLDPRIEQALLSLVPKFRRHYPAFRDEVLLVDIFEEAGRKIDHREKNVGAIERLHAYAWVTLRTIAATRLRRGDGQMARRTFGAEDGAAAIDATPARTGTPEEIERTILLRELLGQLSEEERVVCIWKKAGYTSQEIAERRGTTAGAVDTMLSRIRQKVRDLTGTASGPAAQDAPAERRTSRTARSQAGQQGAGGRDGS
jgi:RNA polymerase sigma factor (sigma-70 family)